MVKLQGKSREYVLLILIIVAFHFAFEISVDSFIYPHFHLDPFFHMGIV